MPTEAQHSAIKAAEKQIHDILNDLAVDLGCDIESVEVDTRPFGQLRTEIFTSVDSD